MVKAGKKATTSGTNKRRKRKSRNIYFHVRYCHVNDFTIVNTDFANYVSSRFTGNQPNDSLQACRLCQESKSDDKLARLIFLYTNIKYYETVHIGKVRLSRQSYAEGKTADDSNINFLLNGMEHPGRVLSIFTIDDGAPLLLVAYFTKLTPLTCKIDKNEDYVYPNMLFTASTVRNYAPIEMKHFIEKCVFFRSSNGVSHFMRYPNLDHCS